MAKPDSPSPGGSATTQGLRVVGRSLPKVDAVAKVTGRTRFADDLFLPRMLHCKLLRATTPHAEIRSIDVRAAAEESAPVVFRAERDVLLDVAETAQSPSATLMPGWIKVRHRDGQTGFIRLSQVFGF